MALLHVALTPVVLGMMVGPSAVVCGNSLNIPFALRRPLLEVASQQFLFPSVTHFSAPVLKLLLYRDRQSPCGSRVLIDNVVLNFYLFLSRVAYSVVESR